MNIRRLPSFASGLALGPYLVMILGSLGVLPGTLQACANGAGSDEIPRYTAVAVAKYPHDANAYTQGLLIDDGRLFESTGRYGRSALRECDLESGKVLRERKLPAEVFAEGLAAVGGKLYQLTWKEQVCYVWDRDTFEPVRELAYEGEGWGLAWDGRNLVMSDGTDTLWFRDPETFAVRREIRVQEEGRPVTRLNELEYKDGEIWANVWQTNRIARISPDTGDILGWIEVRGLLTPAELSTADVLNGIAWDAAAKRLFLTGKLWPKLFEVRLSP